MVTFLKMTNICTFVENKKEGGNGIINATKTWYSATIVGMNHGSHPHYKDNFVTKLGIF